MPARPAHHPLAAVPDRDAHAHLPARWIRRRRTQTPAEVLVGSTEPAEAAAPATSADDVAPVDPATPADATTPAAPNGPTNSAPGGRLPVDLRSQDGSVATEYGLLAVVAATIVSVMLDWATSGGITSLLTSIMARVANIVGL